jgi:hypothetical protein
LLPVTGWLAVTAPVAMTDNRLPPTGATDKSDSGAPVPVK